MYLSYWEINKRYNRGDIVFLFEESPQYYICSISHDSCDLVYPNPRDVYWIKLIPENIDQLLLNYKKNTISFTHKRHEQKLKRKLISIEEDLQKYKKTKLSEDVDNIRDQLLLLNVDIATKSFLIDKHDNLQKSSGSEQSKGENWIKTVNSIPFGKFKQLKIKPNDQKEKIVSFFKDIRGKLDKQIYGLDKVKDEIMEFIARKVSNPNSKGHVLALCGSKGLGKTKIAKSLAEALDLPFYQINFGGLNDSSILLGHSETYVGAKPGKIVESLIHSRFMNPILYLDEVDKISEHRSREINGILTHLLDEEQNDRFQDNYLSNVNLNLSKILFVIAFNDISKVDDIVSDRMKVIYIDPPSIEDKICIVNEKLIPEIIESIKFPKFYKFKIETELLEYIISVKIEKEDGIRQLKKTMEKIFNRINYLLLLQKETNGLIIKEEDHDILINIQKDFIDGIIDHKNGFSSNYMSMYS
jgi:ATP-dependent Lon protease